MSSSPQQHQPSCDQQHQTIIVDAQQQPCRLDHFIIRKTRSVTRTRIQKGIRQGHIQVNRQTVKPSYLIKPQDRIQLHWPKPSPQHHLTAEPLSLDIVYDDPHLLVVNKEAAMVVHPGIGNLRGTLANALVHHFQQLPTVNDHEQRPGLVHRIDKGTSGLLLVAKTSHVLYKLAQQFAARTIQRHYQALVWGNLTEDQGTIDRPIGKSQHDHRLMATYPPHLARGQHAVTHYNVLKRFGNLTLIACRLETGRTHQIRVHMKAIGHPLFGDTRYGGDQIVKGPRFSKYKALVHNCFKLLPHQALHAASLGFVHPISQKFISLTAPLPDAFQAVLDKWQRYTQSQEIKNR